MAATHQRAAAFDVAHREGVRARLDDAGRYAVLLARGAPRLGAARDGRQRGQHDREDADATHADPGRRTAAVTHELSAREPTQDRRLDGARGPTLGERERLV